MIIPSVIPATIHDVERRVGLVKDHVERFHIDIADGNFVPNTTWPIINRNGFQDIVNGDRRLPYNYDVKYEIHLMVQDPEQHIDEWVDAGAFSVIAHSSMLEAPHLTSAKLKKAGIEFGIAVTPIEYQLIDDSLFELADFVLVMGSDDLGKHGVALSDESVDIVKKIAKNFKKPISVDIGVSKTTIARLARAGASRFVSGSAIFSGQAAKKAIDELDHNSK